jgi:spore germination protein YaaH
MNSLRSVFTGLITAAASILIVVGGISLSMSEGFSLAVPATSTPNNGPIVVTQTFLPGSTTASEQPTVMVTVTQLPKLVTATVPVATTCPVPPGWEIYSVQAGDTLLSLATMSHTTADTIKINNCLGDITTTSLMSGMLLALPPIPPTATPTLLPTPIPTHCGPPWNWVRYVIQYGDTLTSLSQVFNISVYQLMAANCLNSVSIRAGEILWVPYVPTRVPTATAVPPTTQPTRTKTTPPPTWTVQPPGITVTPTFTWTPTNTNTTGPSATFTNTPIPPTATPTTAVPTVTVGAGPVTPTVTPAPSATLPPTATTGTSG